MREVTKLMIEEYNLRKLGYDFMGFTFKRQTELSFHHLIVPKRECIPRKIEAEGYVMWNGAVLVQDTSHEYLHVIERLDRDRFDYITHFMVTMNINKKLDKYSLKQIGMILRGFENDFEGKTTKKGKVLIKPSYKNRIF